jgi:hypothetical protein
MMATTDAVVRFTHFGAFAEGSAMPSQIAGMLLAMDPLHNEIIASRRKVHGSTFDTLDRGVVIKSSDPAFRPVYIANAPDGSLYVADMYEVLHCARPTLSKPDRPDDGPHLPHLGERCDARDRYQSCRKDDRATDRSPEPS